MKDKWNTLSQPVKTMILVWTPIIIIGIIYSGLYLGFYINANNIQHKYQTYVNECLNSGKAGSSPWMLSSWGITHGTLGLPEFTASSSEIPSPPSCL
jgi:hypothetical protein